ncbi:MAG: efflux RND transporter permease subunit [Proteobacteria bacterium]|nr:efflux RND transporter permease subunit [Pseudomonadota bacterium]
MEGILRFFINRRFVANLVIIALIAGGLVTGQRAQREGFPSIVLNKVIVTAILPGAAAYDVETKITLPIEEAIEDLDGVDSYYSEISDNLSLTTIELDPDFGAGDIRLSELDIRRAIDAITDFPVEMRDKPTVERIEAAKMPILEIVMEGESTALAAASARMEMALKSVDGVAEVTRVGLNDPEIRVLYSPALGRQYGVTLSDVVGAIASRNVSSTGGLLELAAERRQVVLDARLGTPEQVEETLVRFTADGGQVRVRDVARVEAGREDLSLRVHTNSKPGLSLVVRKRPGADILDTVEEIHKTIAKAPLPGDVNAMVINDISFMTRNRLSIVLQNGGIGIFLVIICLFVFLTRRAAVWVSVGLPAVIATVVVLMPVLGMTVNMISLGGFVVVLGMIVDAAVVVSERIELKRGQGLDAKQAAVEGTKEVILPVVASAITTVLAFTPMLALGGMPGKFIWYFPVTVTLCLVASVLISGIILPAQMTSGITLKRKSNGTAPDKRGFVLALERTYRGILPGVLRRRYLVVLGFVAFFVFVMGVILPMMNFILLPQELSDGLHIKIDAPPGTPLEKTEAVVTDLERQIPGIVGTDLLAVTSRIGHRNPNAVDRVQGSAEHEAVVSVMLQLEGRVHTAHQWSEIIAERLVVPPGIKTSYEIKLMGPPLGRPVTVHVASNDDGARRAAAAAIAHEIGDMPEITDAEVDEKPGIRQIELVINFEKLAMRGLNAEAVAQTIAAAFHGLPVTEYRGLDETTVIRVQFEPSSRRTLNDLLDTPIRNRLGQPVSLRDVVQPVERNAVSKIFHREGIRTATVTAGFRTGSEYDASSFAALLARDLISRFDTEAVHVYIGGEAVETEEVTGDMGVAGGMAVAGILVVVFLMMGSIIEALFIVSVIPFGVAAIILTTFLHGYPLSMFVLLAVIGLSGVVVNGSILMVDSIKRYRAGLPQGASPEQNQEAVINGVVERLRPILVTTVTTLGGVFPLGYGLGGYDAFMSPMSLAIGWGLAFATLITFGLVPALYIIAGDIRNIPRKVRSLFKRG